MSSDKIADDEATINPDVEAIMDLIQDPGPAEEPEERYNYIDLGELWAAYKENDDLEELMDLAMSQSRWSPTTTVPEPIYQRVRTALDIRKQRTSVEAYIKLVRRNPHSDELPDLYRNLYRLCGYDEVAVTRLLIASMR